MQNQLKLPAGVRKHIRGEKARIRREFSDIEQKHVEIEKLYNKFSYYRNKAENNNS